MLDTLNGLPALRLNNDHCSADILLDGGLVTHWQPRGQDKPVLWTSPKAAWVTEKPVRGGIPLCFPWFGVHPEGKPAHGFARNRRWHCLSLTTTADGSSAAVLTLRDDDATRAIWPHAFICTLSVVAGATLSLELTVRNTGTVPMVISGALHSYFAVSDVHQVSVTGFEGRPWRHAIESVSGTLADAPLRFPMPNSDHLCAVVPTQAGAIIHDPTWNRRIGVATGGSADMVVWNPGKASGEKTADIGEHWSGFICVEAANAPEHGITVPPFMSHHLATTINVG